MALRVCSLGSGSGGNALLAGSDMHGYVLLDCGFPVRELELRLGAKGIHADQLRAVIVTHEHGDHIGSAYPFAAKHKLPLLMSQGTARATRHLADKPSYADLRIRTVYDGEVILDFAELAITAFSVPHDSAEPLQFTFQQGERKLGVLTDLGMSTPHVISALMQCHTLVLECNHDEQMLAKGPYPPRLRARVGGNWGHLSNRAAAAMLTALNHSGLKHVIAAHLSRQNNTPELALAALAQVLGDTTNLHCATQAAGFDWHDI